LMQSLPRMAKGAVRQEEAETGVAAMGVETNAAKGWLELHCPRAETNQW
jgi:hypothetical protein